MKMKLVFPPCPSPGAAVGPWLGRDGYLLRGSAAGDGCWSSAVPAPLPQLGAVAAFSS